MAIHPPLLVELETRLLSESIEFDSRQGYQALRAGGADETSNLVGPGSIPGQGAI